MTSQSATCIDLVATAGSFSSRFVESGASLRQGSEMVRARPCSGCPGRQVLRQVWAAAGPASSSQRLAAASRAATHTLAEHVCPNLSPHCQAQRERSSASMCAATATVRHQAKQALMEPMGQRQQPRVAYPPPPPPLFHTPHCWDQNECDMIVLRSFLPENSLPLPLQSAATL